MKQEKELEQEQSLNNKFESKPMPSFIARVVKSIIILYHDIVI
jgi:hypothetical protein